MFCPYCRKKGVQNLEKCPECGKSLIGVDKESEFKCLRCGRNLPADAVYCWFCGEKIVEIIEGKPVTKVEKTEPSTKEIIMETKTRFCTNCGSQIEVGSKFCGNCGARVLQIEAPEISTSGKRCFYCGSDMAWGAIKCSKCGKYLPEIEKDKYTFRILNSMALVIAVALGLHMLGDLERFALRWHYNSGYRVSIIVWGIIVIILELFAFPSWIRYKNRTGEWLIF